MTNWLHKIAELKLNTNSIYKDTKILREKQETHYRVDIWWFSLIIVIVKIGWISINDLMNGFSANCFRNSAASFGDSQVLTFEVLNS